MEKIFDAGLAAKAYGGAQSVAQPKSFASVGAEPVKTESGQSFGDIVQSMAGEALNTIKGGEKVAAKAVLEQANVTDVVQAVNAAEVTLQTIVAVRDKLIGAYQEIMRMPM